jgi:hypothetical protein
VATVGFQPDFLMFLSDDDSTGATLNHAKVSLGYAGRSNAYGITQGASTAVSQFGAANLLTSGAQLATAAILEKDEVVAASSPTFTAAVTSFDANGFTINKTVNTAGTETAVHYLALRGGQYRVGAITRPTTAGASTQAYTGVGFKPHGLLFTSWNLVQQPYDEDARISFSAADQWFSGGRPNQRATFFHDKTDNPADGDNSWVRQGTSGTNVANGKVVYLAQAGDCPPKFAEPANPMQCSAGPRVISQADVASYNADGFTLNWTTNDLANGNQTNPGDETNAQILYVAFGNTVPVLRFFTKVGSFTAGTTNVTGVGFQPKAVIFYWTAQHTTTGFAVNASAGYGFATGPGSERAAIFVSDHDLAPAAHNSGNWQWPDRCIGVVINAAEPSTPDAEAHSRMTTGFPRAGPPLPSHGSPTTRLWAARTSPTPPSAPSPSDNAAPRPSGRVDRRGLPADFLMFLSVNSTTMPTRASPDSKLISATRARAASPKARCGAVRTGVRTSARTACSPYDAIVEAIPGPRPAPVVAAVKSLRPNGFTIPKKIFTPHPGALPGSSGAGTRTDLQAGDRGSLLPVRHGGRVHPPRSPLLGLGRDPE